jgi:VanZ family protein
MVAIIATVLCGLALSTSIEIMQLFDDARNCSGFDVACNVSGVVLGVALSSLYHQLLKRMLVPIEKMVFHPISASLLFCI